MKLATEEIAGRKLAVAGLIYLVCFVSGVAAPGSRSQPRVEWRVDHLLGLPYTERPLSAVDREGNIYVGVSGIENIELAKWSSNGNLLWRLVEASQPMLAMTVNESGEVIITGYSGTLKLNATGAQEWRLPIQGTDVKLDATGNIVIPGMDSRLHKLGPGGQTVWARPHDALPSPYSPQLAIDASGSIYIIGAINFNFPDWITMKFDAAGERLWTRTYDTPNPITDDPFLTQWDMDVPASIVLDSAGNPIVVGHTIDYGREILYEGQGIFRHTLAIKHDPEGRVLWTTRLPGEQTIQSALDGKDNLYIGRRDGLEDDGYYSISKLDGRGRHLWSTDFHGLFSWANGFGVDAKGNSYMAMSFGVWNNSLDSILKFDPHGRQVWSASFSTDRSLRGLRLDARGNVYGIGLDEMIKYGQ
jgi:hypothetical protein